MNPDEDKTIVVLSQDGDHVIIAVPHIVAIQEVSEKDVRGGEVVSKETKGSNIFLSTGGVLAVDQTPGEIADFLRG